MKALHEYLPTLTPTPGEVEGNQPPGPISHGPGASGFPPLPTIQQGWVDLLNRWRFNWFCTLTFRDHTHPEAALKRFSVWISKINEELYGKRYYKRGQSIYWVNAIEFQKRGVIHFHALLGAPENLNHKVRRLKFMDIWYDLAGIARIEEIEDDEAVYKYVSKYVAKGGEIDVSPNIKEFVQQHNLDVPGW